MPIRFHLDEHSPIALAEALRHRGIDVTTSADAGLMGAPDLQQLAFGMRSSRVVVTQDADFLRLHAQGMAHSGIAIWHRSRAFGEVLRRLTLIHAAVSPEEIQGRVEYL